jgi:hypothetical protein
VQLGLRIAYRASPHLGNLAVLISFDIVQDKHRAVAYGQPFHAPFQIDSVQRSLDQQVGRAYVDAW